MNICILTVSDSGALGKRKDTSGDALEQYVAGLGHSVVFRSIVPDEHDCIVAKLKEWTDDTKIDVVFTTGGTGLSSRYNTPEATMVVTEYLIPGIAEAMRLKTFHLTPYSILSRAVAGVRSGSLIINLPGSKAGVKQCIDVIFESIIHAVKIVHDNNVH